MTGGAWVAQSVKGPTSTRVMISQYVSSSPMLGSMLTAQTLEPASDSVPPSVSAPLLLVLSLSLSKINITKKLKKIKLVQQALRIEVIVILPTIVFINSYHNNNYLYFYSY